MTDTSAKYQLTDRYQLLEGQVLLTGVQALARLPIEQVRRDRAAGLNTAAFVSGYPGSPLGGFDQQMARAIASVPDLPIVHQPAVNEELGATSIMGTQLAPGRPDARYDGVAGFWYGKGPGLDRACDALRHSVFTGTSQHGGAVAMVGDDPACDSSTLPSSSDATLVDLHMPILFPGNVAECLELGLHAVAISRACGVWSALKVVTPVADGSGTITLPVLDGAPIIPTVKIDGETYHCEPSAILLGPRMLELEQEFREIRLPLAMRYGVDNALNRVTVDPSDAWIGLVSTGFTYYEMLDSLRRLGLENEHDIAAAGIRILQMRMPVPFDPALVRDFARGLDEIVVVEEKNATLEVLVRDALYGSTYQPRVVGKETEDGRRLMPSWGLLDADAITPGLRERLAYRLDDRLTPDVTGDDAGIESEDDSRTDSRKLIPLSTSRSPYFCSGCPHNWGTKVPDGAVVGAGIGCHGMALLMEPDRVGDVVGLAAMGNEGAQWVGMSHFVETDHFFQNIGDGTFFHSAQLAVQHAIAADAHVTFKILYNGTVAMTGGQDSPFGVGVPELALILVTQGVNKVAITTEDTGRYRGVKLPDGVKVHNRDNIVEVQEDLASVPGVTVLIHDQFCAAELRRSRRRGKLKMPGRRIVINHRICEGCGDCGDVSNCLSVQPIETPLGRKTTIDQASCNFDYSCAKGDCPAFMSVDVGDSPTDHSQPRQAGEAVPDPPRTDFGDHVRIRMAGIGGTGVVTVAQILATAAMFDDWQVQGLDQTGLSQKAGPVVSDVILSRSGSTPSNVIGRGEADLLFGFDALGAAGDGTLEAAGPDRTTVIASTHRTPTGAMVTSPDTPYPTDTTLESRFALFSDADTNRFVDASAMTSALTGSAAQANIFLLGVACQEGHLPVSVESLERAIDLNGVAVEANLAALDWGRRWSHDPVAVEAVAASSPGATLSITVPDLDADLAARVAGVTDDSGLHEHLTMLTADLVAYQNTDYAGAFVAEVAKAASAESAAAADSTAFTRAVATGLHKLMAYKDEYEVARLMLVPEATAAVTSVGGDNPKFRWHLHPPMLKALGLDKKIPIDGRLTPAIKALRAGKKLRGTKFDPFGRSDMRRMERALPDEYRAALERVYPALNDANLNDAIAIAELPDVVRGYEDLKTRRVGEFRDRLASMLREFVASE